MPLDPKHPKIVQPPTYKQLTVLDSIDRALSSLRLILLQASRNHLEMQSVIASIDGTVNQAKKWILENP